MYKVLLKTFFVSPMWQVPKKSFLRTIEIKTA